MRVIVIWSVLAVQYPAVGALGYRECEAFQLGQNSGPIGLRCPFYAAPEGIGNSSTNWGLKVLRNDLAVGADMGYTFTNNNVNGLHFEIEFTNPGLGLEWRSYFMPGRFYCTTNTPGLMTRYQLTC